MAIQRQIALLVQLFEIFFMDFWKEMEKLHFYLVKRFKEGFLELHLRLYFVHEEENLNSLKDWIYYLCYSNYSSATLIIQLPLIMELQFLEKKSKNYHQENYYCPVSEYLFDLNVLWEYSLLLYVWLQKLCGYHLRNLPHFFGRAFIFSQELIIF